MSWPSPPGSDGPPALPQPYGAPQPYGGPQPHVADPYGAPPAGQWAANPWQQPSWSAVPPKKRRSRWWYAALGVLGLAVVAGAGTFLFKGGVEIKHATDSVNEYAAAIVDGRYDDAYEMQCPADRENESLEEFTDAHHATYLGYAIENIVVTTGDGVTSGEARLRLRVQEEPDEQVFVYLRKIDGEWRPCDSG